jgi:hypothetical protein
MVGSTLSAATILDNRAHSVGFDGFSISETGGSDTVTVSFLDSTSSGDLLHAPVIVPAGGLVTVVVPLPVAVSGGSVYVAVSGSGTLSGVIYSRV